MELDLNNAQSRQALLNALDAKEIEAHETRLDAFRAVEVALTPDDGTNALSVVAIAMGAPCMIGLYGYRTVDGEKVECEGAEVLRPETLGVAVEAFETYVANRNAFLRDFQAGKYDV